MRLVTSIISNNEIVYLKNLLPYVRLFSDEIVLVNENDNPKLEALCKKYKVNYLVHPFNGDISAKRNAGLKEIKDGDWVFRVDTDEVPSKHIITNLRQILTEAETQNIDRIRLEIYHLTALDKCKEEIGIEMRLFRKNKSLRAEGLTTENIVSEDFTGKMAGMGNENCLIHFKYLDKNKIDAVWKTVGSNGYTEQDWRRRLSQHEYQLPNYVQYSVSPELIRLWKIKK